MHQVFYIDFIIPVLMVKQGLKSFLDNACYLFRRPGFCKGWSHFNVPVFQKKTRLLPANALLV